MNVKKIFFVWLTLTTTIYPMEQEGDRPTNLIPQPQDDTQQFVATLGALARLQWSATGKKHQPLALSRLYDNQTGKRDLSNELLEHLVQKREALHQARLLISPTELPKIYTIDLSYNYLETVPLKLSALPDLVTLDLSNNGLTRVELPRLARLVSLKLANNHLTSLDDITYENAPKLKNLDLRNNNITTLSSNVVKLGLLRLCLEGNPLMTLPPALQAIAFIIDITPKEPTHETISYHARTRKFTLPFGAAVAAHNMESVKYLEHHTGTICSPYHLGTLCIQQDTEFLAHCLEKYPKTFNQTLRNNLLRYAAQTGNLVATRLLVKHGAHLKGQETTSSDRTPERKQSVTSPRQLAQQHGHTEVAEHLKKLEPCYCAIL